MTIGFRVKVNVDEPEYCNKHGQIGTIVRFETNGDRQVKFEDGQILYFHASELEEVE